MDTFNSIDINNENDTPENKIVTFETNTNFLPLNISKIFINSKYREIISSIRKKANLVCRNKLGDNYIHMAFNKFKKGYVYYDKDGKLISFCIWRESHNQLNKSDNSRYSYVEILLLCAEENDMNLGSLMCKNVEFYAYSNNYKFIKLQPADESLIYFYKKNGYSDPNPNDNYMYLSIEPNQITIRKKNKSLTRKINK
jgi:hypothetical protein